MRVGLKIKKIVACMTLVGFVLSLGVQPALAIIPSVDDVIQVMEKTAENEYHNINMDQILSASTPSALSIAPKALPGDPPPGGTGDAVRDILNLAEQNVKAEALNYYAALYPQDYNYYKDNLFLWVYIRNMAEGYTLKNARVEPIGSPTVSIVEQVYVGSNTLYNNTNREQTLTSAAFEKLIANTVSTTTTKTVGTSVEASSKFNVPGIGETGITVTASFDYTDSNTNSTTETVKYTVPAQNIVVPANSAVEVTSYLALTNISGEVDLKADLRAEGIGRYVIQNRARDTKDYPKMDGSYGYQLEKLVADGKLDLPTNSDGSIIVDGKGKYETVVGSDLIVVVRNINTNEQQTFNIGGTVLGDRDGNGKPDGVDYGTNTLRPNF